MALQDGASRSELEQVTRRPRRLRKKGEGKKRKTLAVKAVGVASAAMQRTEMAPTKRKAVSLDTKQNILEDSRCGFKVSALVKKYKLAQSMISTILVVRQSLRLKPAVMLTNGRGLGTLCMLTLKRHSTSGSSLPVLRMCLSLGPYWPQRPRSLLSFLEERTSSLVEDGFSVLRNAATVHKNVVGETASLDAETKEEWLQMKMPEVLERYTERDVYN